MEYTKYALEITAKYFLDIIIKANSISQAKDYLFELSRKSKINDNYIRPTSWKIMLSTLPSNNGITIENWVQHVQQQRMKYKKKIECMSNIKKYKTDPLDNVLDESWSTFYKETNVCKIIQLDIKRTFQDKELFTQKKTKELLSRILLVWAKEHPNPSYRQGMNDILGILYLSLYQYYITIPQQNVKDDLTILNYAKTDPIQYYKELYLFFHNEKELEPDLFYMFESILDFGLSQMYELPMTNNNSENTETPTYLITRCERIIHEDLNAFNNRLYRFMIESDLDCSIVLQRWLKCLFDREFETEEVVVLWDYILATQKKENKKGFLIADYICLAMIDHVKFKIINKDQNDALKVLFRYPKFESMQILIDLTEKIMRELPKMLYETAKPQNELEGKSIMEEESRQHKESKSKYYTYVTGQNKNDNNNNNTNNKGNMNNKSLKLLVRNLEENITKYRLDMQLRDVGRMDELFEKIYTILKK